MRSRTGSRPHVQFKAVDVCHWKGVAAFFTVRAISRTGSGRCSSARCLAGWSIAGWFGRGAETEKRFFRPAADDRGGDLLLLYGRGVMDTCRC